MYSHRDTISRNKHTMLTRGKKRQKLFKQRREGEERKDILQGKGGRHNSKGGERRRLWHTKTSHNSCHSREKRIKAQETRERKGRREKKERKGRKRRELVAIIAAKTVNEE